MKCESAPKINPDGEMVISSVYASYMRHLLGGDYSDCIKIVKELVASQVDFRDIYTKLFQRSLYEVGELWEKNEIPVAHEHMVTALTELLLTVLHPHIFRGQRCGKKALVACAAEGTHRIGAKMVTDIFELHGWDAVFVPTPVSIEGILLLLDKHCPDMLGLSLTHNFHLPLLELDLKSVRNSYSQLPIILGGRAFIDIKDDDRYRVYGAHVIRDIDSLEKRLSFKFAVKKG